jgi:hypothetical protein
MSLSKSYSSMIGYSIARRRTLDGFNIFSDASPISNLNEHDAASREIYMKCLNV